VQYQKLDRLGTIAAHEGYGQNGDKPKPLQVQSFLPGFLPGAAAPDSSDGTDEAFG